MKFRPLLAANADVARIKYPVYVSPKYDGIRCLLTEKGPRSRTGKEIPNKYIQNKLSQINHRLDGEIILSFEEKPETFSKIQSAVMSTEGEPDFVFKVFDSFEDLNLPFEKRYKNLLSLDLPYFIEIVPQSICNSLEELKIISALNVFKGFEGTMIRSPEGRYKTGRSTLNEGILLKLKDFADDEATIIDVQELLQNNNPSEKSSFGVVKKSTKKENLSQSGRLGSLIVSFNGATFAIGTGFTEEEREFLWKNKPIGKKVTFRYQEISPLGIPRFPSFRHIREDI